MYYMDICVIFFLVCLQEIMCWPHIFSQETYCDVTFPDKKTINVPGSLSKVNTTNFDIYYSFCEYPQKCEFQSSLCLVNKFSKKIISFRNRTFSTAITGEYQIKWQGPMCNSFKNYTILLTLVCANSMPSKPLLTHHSDDCEFEISMLSPGCTPKCTGLLYDKYLLDLRNLNMNNHATYQNMVYSFNICGVNAECKNDDISVCEIQNSGSSIVPLASFDSHILKYDAQKMQLIVKGHWNKTIADIIIKCNWNKDLFNATFKKGQIQGRRYTLEVESSYGCVKLPQKCDLIGLDYSNYNLSGLYKTNSHWKVANYSAGDMFLNICGQLELKDQHNVCTDQYSQVCEIKSDTFVNRGSIPADLKEFGGNLMIEFSHGSECVLNETTLSHSTKIEFQCSVNESGPVFKEERHCVTYLQWNTPHACPFDYYKGEDCYILDRLGHRNLASLYSTLDKTYSLIENKSVKILYNICGPLHKSCDGYNNVSFCLKTQNNKETAIGFNNKDLISTQGILKLELEGDFCSNKGDRYHTAVEFSCSFENSSKTIFKIKDVCRHHILVYTSAACLTTSKFNTCIYKKDASTYYNLSPLIQKHRNYIYNDTTENVQYVFNICGPLISGPDALCHGSNTMVCRQNVSEPNINKKFVSLGTVALPKFIDDRLVIESMVGAYCEELGYYRTIINFECAQDDHEAFNIVDKSPCTYVFKWKTKYACPVNFNCLIENSTINRRLDLSNLTTKLLRIPIENKAISYDFHLCQNNYTKHELGEQLSHKIRRELKFEQSRPTIVMYTNESCSGSDDSKIAKLVVQINCNKYALNDSFTEKSLNNCTLNLVLETNFEGCFDEHQHHNKEQLHNLEPKTKNNSYYDVLNDDDRVYLPAPKNKIINCTYVNDLTGKIFNLTDFPTIKMNEPNDLVLNTNGSIRPCRGFLCKNDLVLIPALKICPVVSYLGSAIELHIFTQIRCNDKNDNITLRFKCTESKIPGSITQQSSCLFEIEYYTTHLCIKSIKNESQEIMSESFSAIQITGITLPIIIIVFIAIVISYFKKRSSPSSSSYGIIRSHSKSSTMIYTKDTTC